MSVYVSDKSQTVIACTVGGIVKLTRPLWYKGADLGLDPKVGINGFKIIYPELGEFIDYSTDEGKSWVKYQHLRSGSQIIEFYSNTLGTHKFTCVLQGITVHDHASVAMGGPAFATYYSEPISAITEEGS